MITRSKAAVTLMALAAASAVSGCGALTGAVEDVVRTDGPLREVSEHAWAIGLEPGTTFTDGFETLVFDADGEVEIKNVRLLGDPDFDLVGVSLGAPDRTIGSVQYSATYPPRHADLNGHIIEDGLNRPLAAATPQDIGWELLLGIRVNEPGRHVRTGLEVTYTYDGHTYEETLPALLAVCVGDDLELQECELPELSID